MKILNFGSLNLDYVYSVDHFVAEGETLASSVRNTFCGGKGLNQSVALARAGARVYHAGCIGPEGGMLSDMLLCAGVNVKHVKEVDTPTGHAIIQVDPKGRNCILLFGGANQCNDPAYIDEVLTDFDAGDWLVLQNEISSLSHLIASAKQKGMIVVLNPSPFDKSLIDAGLGSVDYLLLNETEGKQLTGYEAPADILKAIRASFPTLKVVLTLGKDGCIYDDTQTCVSHGIYDVKAVDTTAAGDTFTGFFISAISQGASPADAIRRASAASAIAVSRPGAAPSVPTSDEVDAFLAANTPCPAPTV
ncbi:MAG: ribokinase [Ruminococcaceae bacterium]|nr:ribokinase [Oscillospiraceae bacterium]